MITTHSRTHLTHDLFLPLLLFGALGGMTWAVRGSSGFGASAGCIFAGVTLGAAWWFIAREPGGKQTRRYSSGWIVLAMTVAFGIAGNRGWMQWPAFWDNRIYIDYSADVYTYIDRSYGFLWLFIAGVPWAGLGACMIAWCANGRRTAPWLWLVRLAFGLVGCYLLSVVIYDRYPHVFLPLYDSLRDEYLTSPRGKNLWKMIRDNREAMQQMGLYLGFLLFEVVRLDWKNVTLIATVGIVNGVGWALLQNWSWADDIWPGAQFNFWRCWESSGGISIGIAFAVAYFLVNRRMSDQKAEEAHAVRVNAPAPNAMWLVAYVVYAVVLAYLAKEVMPVWNGLSNLLEGWQVHPLVANWFFSCLCSAVLMVMAVGFAVGYYARANAAGQRADVDDAQAPAGDEEGLGRLWLLAYVVFIAVLGYVALAVLSIGPFSERVMQWAVPEYLAHSFVLSLCAMTLMAILIAIGAALYRNTYPPHDAYAQSVDSPALERWGAYLGLILGLGISIERGFKGWANIYLSNEHFWDNVGWIFVGSAMVFLMAILAVRLLRRHSIGDPYADVFPRAYGIMWFVILVQNVIALCITGPYSSWNEVVFNIYYVLLFFITIPIVFHYHYVKKVVLEPAVLTANAVEDSTVVSADAIRM